MPRNEYGPDDPETISITVRPGHSLCECGAIAVTMRPGGERDGKMVLKPMCAECSRREGEAEKKEILASHSKRRKKILEWLNAEMIELYRNRETRDPSTAWVTVVDARRAYRRAPDTDPNADLRFLGSLFRSRGWEKIPGLTAKNTDEGNHARPVDCWRYVGGAK